MVKAPVVQQLHWMRWMHEGVMMEGGGAGSTGDRGGVPTLCMFPHGLKANRQALCSSPVL